MGAPFFNKGFPILPRVQWGVVWFGLASGNEPYVGEEESRCLLLRELFEIHKRKEGPYNGVLASPKNVKFSQKHFQISSKCSKA
jgi:hypothetical protein